MNFSSIRAKRVVKAFINCVEKGSMSYDYACITIEDTDKYGYLTDSDKENFYSQFETEEVEEVTE